jgi:hypothetical protein
MHAFRTEDAENVRGSCEEKYLYGCYVPERLVGEVEAAMKEEALEIVKECGLVFSSTPWEQRVLELCREVVRQNGWVLYYVPEELRERVYAAVKGEAV